MKLNAEFSKLAFVHTKEISWQDSPQLGVQRKMLDRIGDEVARATSIVRYAPGSHFSSHTHTGGEEFFVIEGVFQDEYGDYPAGSYVRNPPESSHTPRSDTGCIIFVKLWQFDLSDRRQVNVNFAEQKNIPRLDATTKVSAVKLFNLYQDHREHVRIETWRANSKIVLCDPGGIEILVLSGNFFHPSEKTHSESEHFTELSWLRVPIDKKITLTCGKNGATVWIKSGHLLHIIEPS